MRMGSALMCHKGVHQLGAASTIWADLFEREVLDVTSNLSADLFC